jgi:hypothetical protein
MERDLKSSECYGKARQPAKKYISIQGGGVEGVKLRKT